MSKANQQDTYLTTKELAELLRIKERKVYDLAASGEIPCTRATGKLLFPRRALESWLAQHASGPVAATRNAVPDVFLGSHDPLLEWALRESECGIPTYFESSSDGLERFAASAGLACGLHSRGDQGGWNTEIVHKHCSGQPVVLLEWAKRQRGLIYDKKSNPEICSIEHIAGCTVTPRQPGAGAQSLLLDMLAQNNIDADTINWTAAVKTESDAALSVLEGKSDVAFGLKCFAQQYRLAFVPVIEEQFDLLMQQRTYFESPMQKLLNFCKTDKFKIRAEELTGYDISMQWMVHYNAQ